jgi:nucleoside-diphosphate-sugar epimerase
MTDELRLALVTGASGFIGSHLVEKLLEGGWRVRCLIRATSRMEWLPTSRAELVRGDVADDSASGREALAAAARGATVVFHLAAVTSAARDADYDRINVGGTEGVARAASRTATRPLVVLCSSLAAAGPSVAGRAVREGDADRPISAYGRSKLAAERILEASSVPHAIVRPPAVYGPRDADILAAFRLAKRGLALRVGPPRQRLSMAHARDIAAGLIAAAERPATGLYYLSDGIVHEWEDVVGLIAEAVGRRSRIVPVPQAIVALAAHADRLRARVTRRKPLLTPDRVRELVQPEWTCDDSRARQELGYSSGVALRDGLRETAAWYRAHGWL